MRTDFTNEAEFRAEAAARGYKVDLTAPGIEGAPLAAMDAAGNPRGVFCPEVEGKQKATGAVWDTDEEYVNYMNEWSEAALGSLLDTLFGKPQAWTANFTRPEYEHF